MMPSLRYGQRDITVEIVPTPRNKTVGIRVALPSKVIVRSPRSMGKAEVIGLVRRRLSWVVNKLRDLERIEKCGEYRREFVSGESFPYLGRNYRLKIVTTSDDNSPACRLIGGRLTVIVSTDLEAAQRSVIMRKFLVDWYKNRAAEKLKERLERYQKLSGRAPNGFCLKGQKKRWGSCTSKGILYLNWKIILAPLPIVDYVVVHELCHLVERGHNSRFWSLVESIFPDYRKRRAWLKQNSSLLGIIS